MLLKKVYRVGKFIIKMLGCICRGPAYGNRGKVVLVFKENQSSKIGVRFDESVPEGNDLGGRCETDHGFFCAGEVISFRCCLAHLLLKASTLVFHICIDIVCFSFSLA